MRSPRPFFLMMAVLSVITQSCGSGMKMSRSEFVPLPPGFSGTFHVHPNPSERRHQQPPDILRIFDQPSTNSDTVHVSVDQRGRLMLHFIDGMSRRTENFTGTFKKRGYFELYTRREIKEVPPVVPIIHGSRQVNRIRLALAKDGSLVVDHKWENTANIFLLAGGGSGRAQYFFKAAR